MKFSEEFEKIKNSKYSQYYIDYDLLKKYNLRISNLDIKLNNHISIYHRQESYLYQNEHIFIKLLNSEINKCIKFIETEYDKIYKEIDKEIMNTYLITNMIDELEKFINLNKLVIYKILKKHDKYTNIKYLQSIFVNELIKKMYNFNFNKLLIALNKKIITEKIEIKQDNMFIRKSNKFLIKLENITKVKTLLSLYFPIKFYHNNKDLEYQTISSIYFDTNNFEMYNERIERYDNSKIIRFRWYETDIPEDNIFAEIKTHSNNEISMKERTILSVDDFVHYINGKCNCKEDKTEYEKKIFKNINNLLIDKKMKPQLRIVYNRTTFENSNIKITFDTDLYSFKEYKISSMESFNKYDVHLKDDELMNLNYGILEIKTNGIEMSSYDIINKLIENNYIEEIPKFSKYLTCCYKLYSDVLQNIPHWFSSLDFNNDENSEENLNESEYKKELDEKIVKYPIVINPAVIISNQRLFLKWISIGIKFIFLAFLLRKYMLIDYSIILGLIIFSTMIISTAVYQYFDNIDKINNKMPLNNYKNITLYFGIITLLINMIIVYFII